MELPAETVAGNAPPREEELAAALDEAVAALLSGRPIDRGGLLARYPQLAEALGGLERLVGQTVTAADSRAEPTPLPERIGPYRVERELGAGGFGVVYLAYDPDVKRRVALKVLHPGRLHQPEAVARFQREARATARLRHAGIVQLYDYSRQGPPYYLVTEHIAGEDPRAWCRRRQATAAQVAELIAQVAEAVEHAHVQGVCHRDLKPGNILVDDEGRPHVFDFGLARLEELTEETALPTSDGRVLGSLPYMAPEQAAGHSRDADARSDVYSLGVTLYELLTGRLPFQGPLHALPARVMEENAPPPRLFNADVPRDLEAVCLKALAKRPEQRYVSAAALAADLRAFLAGQPVLARPLTLLRRVRRGLQRRHHDVGGRGWGRLLMALGGIILTAGVIASRVEQALPPERRLLPLLGMGVVMVAAMLGLARLLRPIKEPRLTAVERQIVALVPAYYGASMALMVLNLFLPQPGIPLAPVKAVLSGMTFITLGATVWGWCYVWGVFFFLLAVVITFCAPHGLFVLGVGWMVCLTACAAHLRWTR